MSHRSRHSRSSRSLINSPARSLHRNLAFSLDIAVNKNYEPALVLSRREAQSAPREVAVHCGRHELSLLQNHRRKHPIQLRLQ
jgi:hypothetical protein